MKYLKLLVLVLLLSCTSIKPHVYNNVYVVEWCHSNDKGKYDCRVRDLHSSTIHMIQGSIKCFKQGEYIVKSK